MRISGRVHRGGAAAWALAAATAAALLGCRPSGGSGESNEGVSQPPVPNLPAIPDPAPAMDRADLLAAVAKAASAAFAGADDLQAQRLLDGSPFELHIRFGCGGPDAAAFDAGLGWTFEGEERTLRVRARPTISDRDPVVVRVVQAVGDGTEAVEGFWIPRPWLISAACPPALPGRSGQPAAEAEIADESTETEAQEASAAPVPVPAFPKVGIAQFFTDAEPRGRRRKSRAYESVKTLAESERPSASGFDLVLSGRLRSLAGGRVIACVATGPDSPPDCIISADFDEVRIELPDTRDVLAQWGTG